MEARFCEQCGREFVPHNAHQVTCSRWCRRALCNEYARRYYAKKMARQRAALPGGRDELTRLVNEAKAAGVSYGRYVAQRERSGL